MKRISKLKKYLVKILFALIIISLFISSFYFLESSKLKTLGLENALGLDQGGSTALWFNGYKAGPGRSLPSTLLFVRK